MANEKENEKLGRAFYEATVPGHREKLRGIQASHVIYDLPEGMPIGCGHFEGLQDVLERFLTSFYGAFDVRLLAEEFIAAGEHVVAIGRIEQLEKLGYQSMCPSPTSGQSARGIFNDSVLSPTPQC